MATLKRSVFVAHLLTVALLAVVVLQFVWRAPTVEGEGVDLVGAALSLALLVSVCPGRWVAFTSPAGTSAGKGVMLGVCAIINVVWHLRVLRRPLTPLRGDEKRRFAILRDKARRDHGLG